MENRPAMQTRIIGVYDSREKADTIAEQLLKEGLSRNQIYVSQVGKPKEILHSPARQESVHDELKHFFQSVFDDAGGEWLEEAYADAMKSCHVVSVDTLDEEQTETINAFMSRAYASPRPENEG